MKTLQCRLHGGTFQVVPKRGRPPTNCGGTHGVCSRYPAEQRKVDDMQERAGISTRRQRVAPVADEVGFRKPDESKPEAPKAVTTSVAAAVAVKARLEPLGWRCKGRGYEDTDGGMCAELTAARDGELLVMHWLDGECVSQDYSLWYEKPSANSKPKGNLSFDPDECTDRELVRALSGMRVTWWNVLGQKEESGVIGANKIKIEHAYNGIGDEMPGDRIVHFTDHAGTGYRAFRVGALLEVG